jgi:hypothetical protein
MQFLQEFSIEQGVNSTKKGLVLGFVWRFSGNGGCCVPGFEGVQSLKKNGVPWGDFIKKKRPDGVVL